MLFLGTLAAIATGVGLPTVSILLGNMTDNTSFDPDDRQNMIDTIKSQAYITFYISVAIFVTSYLMYAFWMMTGERVAIQIRVRFFKAILRQEVAWFDRTNPQELSTKINQQCTLVQQAVGEKMANVIMSLAMLCTGIIIAFSRGWQLALIILALGPLVAAAMILIVKAVQGAEKKSQMAYAAAGAHS